jgi:Na+/proline symporter
MRLTSLDWLVIAVYGLVALVTGLVFARRAGRGVDEYFLAGRNLPWWLLGTSMVATTFSTDTPNLVTDLVRTGGVSQNWLWWAFVLTGMCTVFFYAKLWRRSGILTDIGFYELRYSGRPAAFLRGFRAIYLGVFFNVMIMATVTLAAIKIGGVLLGATKYQVVLVAGAVTAVYSVTSGLWGVVVTDLLLFAIAMVGAVAAAYYAVIQPEVGGLAGLFSHPEVVGKLSLLPDFSDWRTAAAVFVVPIAVQWWSTWYPGAEPGGGGYVAQRMLAAKDEGHALKATLWFNVAHYALRPWPWILVALASLVIYPSLASIQAAFPHLDPSIVKNDLAYPAMLVFLPSGLLGLVVASLAAAYMSTVSTHLNWGASYVVDDVYRRFVAPDREERHYVAVGRMATLVLVVLASAVALWLQNAMQAFQILLQIGAGTGLVFLLRWFWWRVNAWSELAAMVVSFGVALYFGGALSLRPVGVDFILAWPVPAWSASTRLVTGVAITTVGWLAVTFLTRPASRATMQAFYDRIHPMGPGWRGAGIELAPSDPAESPTAAFLAWFLGCLVIYAALFGTGYALYGRHLLGGVFLGVSAMAAWGVLRLLPRVGLR